MGVVTAHAMIRDAGHDVRGNLHHHGFLARAEPHTDYLDVIVLKDHAEVIRIECHGAGIEDIGRGETTRPKAVLRPHYRSRKDESKTSQPKGEHASPPTAAAPTAGSHCRF